MNKKILLRVAVIILYITLLFFLANILSLSSFEVNYYYDKNSSILYHALNLFTYIFGQKDLVLRAFMIITHLLSLYLFYHISNDYLVKERDKLWNIIIFILLPAIVSSAIIVHPSGIILSLLLFFIYAYKRWGEKALVLLLLYLFIDISFFILFLGLIVFFFMKKNWLLVIFNIFLLVASIYIFGLIGEGGSPKNYVSHVIGIASLVFSPLLFLYFIYTLFRVGYKKNRDLIWTLSTVSFILLLILSVRQRVQVEYFAPYWVILLPIMVKQFMHSYRIRVRVLRKNYKLLFAIAIFFLLVNSLIVYLNKYLYNFLDDPKKHFFYKHYVAKDLAKVLKEKGYTKILVKDKRLRIRLKFYGISANNPRYLLEDGSCENIILKYNDKKIASYCVVKIIEKK